MHANGVAIREWRKARGYRTATAFALELGISPQYLCDIEAGRRNGNPELLERMARVLKIDERALLEVPKAASL